MSSIDPPEPTNVLDLTMAANRTLCEEHSFAYEAIPGTGHMLQLEKPEACIASATSFLKTSGIQ